MNDSEQFAELVSGFEPTVTDQVRTLYLYRKAQALQVLTGALALTWLALLPALVILVWKTAL